MKPITVLNIHSLSFTGTTWLNMVLGSHPDAFPIGPPERLWNLAKAGKLPEACRVHADDCPFWRGFGEQYDSRQNLLTQIADYAGKKLLVINNPSPGFQTEFLDDKEIAVRQLNLIRDPRAVLASFLRGNPDNSFLEGLVDWLRPALESFHYDEGDNETLCMRYEDVLDAPESALTRIGAFVGLEYTAQALQYWEHDLHPVAGNTGTLSLIRFQQGLQRISNERSAHYFEQLEKMRTQGPAAFSARDWADTLTAENRIAYDLVCGEQADRFGYTRDRFALEDLTRFGDSLPPEAEKADGAVGVLGQAMHAWYSRVCAALSVEPVQSPRSEPVEARPARVPRPGQESQGQRALRRTINAYLAAVPPQWTPRRRKQVFGILVGSALAGAIGLVVIGYVLGSLGGS